MAYLYKALSLRIGSGSITGSNPQLWLQESVALMLIDVAGLFVCLVNDVKLAVS